MTRSWLAPSAATAATRRRQKHSSTLSISDLPPEMILLIASMLPKRSAACLSGCNRTLSHILALHTWPSLKHEPVDVLASFLYDLSKDFSEYFVCYRCNKLHTSSKIQQPRQMPKTLTSCLEAEPAYECSAYAVLYLRFPHIQLAMKHHRLGSGHGFPLESFQRTVVTKSDFCGYTELLSVDAQIVSDELLLRSLQWLVLPRSRCDELGTSRYLHHICTHIWSRSKAENNITTLFKSRLDLLEAEGQCSTATAHCMECQIDYVLDAVDLGDNGIAACLTRWTNVGSGLHPEDPKWRCHLSRPLSNGFIDKPHSLGSIRSKFESQTAKSYNEFTARNKFNLCSTRKYWPVTGRADRNIWKKIGGAPHQWCLEDAEETFGWAFARVLGLL